MEGCSRSPAAISLKSSCESGSALGLKTEDLTFSARQTMNAIENGRHDLSLPCLYRRGCVRPENRRRLSTVTDRPLAYRVSAKLVIFHHNGQVGERYTRLEGATATQSSSAAHIALTVSRFPPAQAYRAVFKQSVSSVVSRRINLRS